MDGNRFDDIARALAGNRPGATSRRTILSGLAGFGAGLAGMRAISAAAACPPEQLAKRDVCVCKTTGRPPAIGGFCPCPNGLTRCDGSCLDLSADEANCGACGVVCAAGQDCRRGVCICNSRSCPNGCCDDSGLCRIDDDLACGAGGKACTACTGTGQTCGGGGIAGVCGCSDDGMACTGRVCGTATNNCGQLVSCGSACPDDLECSGAGQCVCTSTSCPDGCCDATGQCRRDDDAACGMGGGLCTPCTGTGQTCGGGGTPGVCGCTPEDAAVLCVGKCGSVANNCGQIVDCTAHCAGCCTLDSVCLDGSADEACGAAGVGCTGCAPPQTCGGGDAPRTCGCTPLDPATACAGKCGSAPNGCGGNIDCTPLCTGCCTIAGACDADGTQNSACGAGGDLCHVCVAPDTCGGGDTPGVCGCTAENSAVTCAGVCGRVTNNCGQEIECPECGDGKRCCDGACLDVRNDINNCGSCGEVCESHPESCTAASCQGGQCVFSTVLNCCKSDGDCGDGGDNNPCTIGICDPVSLTCKTVPAADNTSCGSGMMCCEGSCVDVSSDGANCGSCGSVCEVNQQGTSGCLTGACFLGTCAESILICPSCATPVCDPDQGGICVNNCPPPTDSCHLDGACQLNGTCTYEPKCGPCDNCVPPGICQPKHCGSCLRCDPSNGTCSLSACGLCGTCDPSSGACSPKVCGPCEQCDPNSGECVLDCPPINNCTIATRCHEGFCVYGSTCGVCELCEANGECAPFPEAEGSTCAPCRVCDSAGNCVRAPQGASCGTCQVCTAAGTCQFGAEGTYCGTCRICSAGLCVPAAQAVGCGDGSVCDGNGNCVCAMTCGPHCCPDGTVDCCILAENDTPSDYRCCSAACTVVPGGGTICPGGSG